MARTLDADDLKRLLDAALGALADIGTAGDMTLGLARMKAMRVYAQIREEYSE